MKTSKKPKFRGCKAKSSRGREMRALDSRDLKGLRKAAQILQELRRVTFDLDRDSDILDALHAIRAASDTVYLTIE